MVSSVLASAMAFIDFTALNVAFPSIQKDLELAGADLLWIANGYALFLSSLILVGGSLGDQLGRKWIFMFGIILFTLSSIACGFSQSAGFLIIARCFQGIGGAMMVPGSLSIISSSFPQESRGKAIGTWSMFSAMTTIFGPALGGWLASMDLWRMIFFINIPLALVSLFLLVRYVPESKQEKNQGLDFEGALLITLALASLTYGFIEAPEKGFNNPLIYGTISLGTLLLIAFLLVQSRSKKAMMPLDLFKNRIFLGANLLTLLLYGALGGFLFFFPLNLIQVQSYPPEIAGFTMLPFGLLIAFLSRVSGAWADKVGTKIPLLLGSTLVGIGFFLFSMPGLTAGPADYWTSFFPAILIAGTGMGLTVAPLTTSVMNSVDPQKTGTASGVNNSISRTAGVLAVAVIGSFFLSNFSGELFTQLTNSEIRPEIIQITMNDSPKLAELIPSIESFESEKKIISEAVKFSFIDSFKMAARIASALAFCSALIALFSFKKDS